MIEEAPATAGRSLSVLTADVVASYVSSHAIATDALPGLIRTVHDALAALNTVPQPEAKPTPAVAIRTSVKPDHIVCLEDGRKLKMLKRYLRINYGMTPEAYRRRWNLPPDYPMVAPDYAEQRRSLAHSIGLGRKGSPAAPRRSRTVV